MVKALEITRTMIKTRVNLFTASQIFKCYLFLSIILTACSAIDSTESYLSPLSLEENTSSTFCPVTEPEWVKPPEDSAVEGLPEFGYYYVNQDRSIWASAWWTGEEKEYLRMGEEGLKMGWFRPEGAELEITGHRIDGQASHLDAHAPCCYPTRFQATGLTFPSDGCWEVTAKAAESELSFSVQVYP
jgi:hypothetical protein